MSKKNGRFELPLRTAVLRFHDEYEGAEMRCRLDVPLELYFQMTAMADTEDMEKVKAAIRLFGDEVVLETNLNISGEEVTPDADGLLRLPMGFVTQVITQWAEAAKESPLAETPTA